jgi:hypothetical protein
MELQPEIGMFLQEKEGNVFFLIQIVEFRGLI